MDLTSTKTQTTPSGLELTRAVGPMLRELRAVIDLADDDPRRVAALAEKHRLLDAIAAHEARA
jgi:hypothetical protein